MNKEETQNALEQIQSSIEEHMEDDITYMKSRDFIGHHMERIKTNHDRSWSNEEAESYIIQLRRDFRNERGIEV